MVKRSSAKSHAKKENGMKRSDLKQGDLYILSGRQEMCICTTDKPVRAGLLIDFSIDQKGYVTIWPNENVQKVILKRKPE